MPGAVRRAGGRGRDDRRDGAQRRHPLRVQHAGIRRQPLPQGARRGRLQGARLVRVRHLEAGAGHPARGHPSVTRRARVRALRVRARPARVARHLTARD